MNYSVEKKSEHMWEIPLQGAMRARVVIYADATTTREMHDELASGSTWSSLRQLVNVAQLPGVLDPVVALADVHPGYGFPIGGIAAFDMNDGVVCVAGVGFDCNCGVRMMTTPLMRTDILKQPEALADALFRMIPAGVGSKGTLTLSERELDAVIRDGAAYAVKSGHGFVDDLEYIEEHGRRSGADPEAISAYAKERQAKQMGTLGSGNHYLELQYVSEIYDDAAARAFGLVKDGVTVAIHCGSRALGHQVGTDYLKLFNAAARKYGIQLPDKELVCVPVTSSEGQRYLAAIAGAVNCAFANRQILAHLVRDVFKQFYMVPNQRIKTLYDVGHNNARVETMVRGKKMTQMLIHRKGSTRALGPGHAELPTAYRAVGQPVLVGGTMGTASYILKGTTDAGERTFASSIHGAGRMLSRTEAMKRFKGRDVVDTLRAQNIIVRCASSAGVAEEAPGAYKNIDEVVAVVDNTAISTKVAQLKPLMCIKG